MNENKQMTLFLTPKEQALGWGYLVFQFLFLPRILVLICEYFGILSASAVNLIYYIINAAACALIFRRLVLQSLGTLRRKKDSFWEAAIQGFLFYFLGTILAGHLTLALMPDFSNENNSAVLDMVSQMPFVMAFAVVVLVPFAEECLFRGLFFIPLARKNVALAYTVTTLAFSVVHVVGYLGVYDGWELAVATLQYLPTAALCWACRKADSLLAPMVIHAAVNATSLLILR